MKKLIEDLWLKNRAIVSDGFAESLDYIAERIPLIIHKIPSGAECFDWTVPQKWIIRDAYIEADGKKLVDYKDHPLHVVIGSLPVDKKISFMELLGHLHWDSDDPHAIPYIHKYYDKDWGFCICKRDLSRLARYDELYVKIDAEYEDGDLLIGECVIEGTSGKGMAFFSHLDHPAQVQDGLSGCAALVELAARVGAMWFGNHKPFYTYRFLFFAETIGSIAYFATFPDRRDDIAYGCCFEMVGVPNQPFVLQRTKKSSYINDVARVAMFDVVGKIYEAPFLSIVVNDDGIFNSPGIDVPAISISQSASTNLAESKHFVGYHTSRDDIYNLDMKALSIAVEIGAWMVMILEYNFAIRRNYVGIPHLSSHNLWVARSDNATESVRMKELLHYIEDGNTILDVTLKTGIPYSEVWVVLNKLEIAGLVSLY